MLSETSKTIVGIIIDQLEKGDKKGQKEYGVSIDDAEDVKYNWNLEAMQEMADALKYQQKEIEFLKQRNRDLRQKSWFQVYEENLKSTEMLKVREDQLNQSVENSEHFYNEMIKAQSENKTLKNTVDQLRKELIKVGQVADNFHANTVKLNNENQKLYEENKHLKEVIQSVETFVNQFTR